MDSSNPKKPASRRRARKADGQFKGDNPTTPGLNEAWESTDIEVALPKKENKYAVKQKVGGTSQDSAGKYSKKAKVKPTFGQAHTTFN